MELFLKIVNSLTPLTILTKSSILDVWPGSENATKSSNKSCVFNIFSFSSRLNTFFPFTLKIFRSSSIRKRFSTSNIQIIFIQTNIYVKTQVCKFLFVAKTRQWCLIITKEIFIIFIWRKSNMFNFFILKWKRIKPLFFVKYTVILVWSLENDHFKMIVYFSL